MEWTKELRHTLPREEIPRFLQDLQRLVRAMREGDEEWEEYVTDRLRAHPALVLGYMEAGKKRDRVERALQA